ncbi:MAG: mechanosensitive ion channel [Sandaracinus sp.]|nr:mechanosensitive ion channel [Sandaracinus sp.]MCB9636267.1 mechanosensitive ion channel [Sandaracinus sp.]
MDDPTQLLRFLRAEGFVPAALVLVATWLMAGGTSRVFGRMTERFPDRRLVLQQTKAILRLLLFVAGIATAVGLLFRLSDEAMLGLGGTVAVAVGFAFKDLMASMIAGIIILLDRPFQVGDRITFAGFYGEVVEIGLRTVRLVTLDDSLVTIPNNKFLTDPVSSGNAGALDMLVQIDFHVGADQDLTLAKRLVSEALTASRFAYLSKPSAVVVSPVVLGSVAAIRLRAKVYVLDVKYEKALETDVTEQIVEAFAKHRILPPALLHRDANGSGRGDA